MVADLPEGLRKTSAVHSQGEIFGKDTELLMLVLLLTTPHSLAIYTISGVGIVIETCKVIIQS